MSSLSELEKEQYSRQIRLSHFGEAKQEQLKAAKVLLVGAGGLGCPTALYLAAAGVGTLGLVDFDRVERSNLQRQIAHGIADIDQLKVDSLASSLQALNPWAQVVKAPIRLDKSNVEVILADYDLVIDGSDNFATRFLVADACYLFKKPLLQAAIYEYEAQMSLFLPGEGACYRCVFQEPPKKALAPCAEVGVLGVLPGTVGTLVATEAIKFLTGLGQSIQGKLLIYDALQQSLRHLQLSRNAACPLCGDHPSITTLQEIEGAPCTIPQQSQISSTQAQALIQAGCLIVDIREQWEWDHGHLPQAVHLPLSQLNPQTAKPILDSRQPVILYCQKGQRSLIALQRITDWQTSLNSPCEIYSLQNGLAGWPNAPIAPLEQPSHIG